MAAIPSAMIPLGTPCPAFELPDTVSGRAVRLQDFDGSPALLVMFICNHCPFVKHIRDELARLGREYRSRGVGIVAISSNDAAKYPADGPEQMREEARAAGYDFPYLYDESQDVARAFGAACTPDFFVYDRQRRLAYRGQLDASRPPGRSAAGEIPVTGKDLRSALEAVLAGRPVPGQQLPSIGCNIKWK
ncbi:MAG: thioredoxin family protein [Phycisphaerae bacterium]|nr:thioredoxin family protein [Phycisphaerae bacterium]